jgi:hypothetical protein
VTIAELALVVIAAAILIIACATVWQVAHEHERGLEREERHKLKAELAAYRALLLHHGLLPEAALIYQEEKEEES